MKEPFCTCREENHEWMQVWLPIRECNCTIYKEDAVALLPKRKKKNKHESYQQSNQILEQPSKKK